MKTRLLIGALFGGAALAAHAAGARLVPPEQVCAAARELITEAASRQGLQAAVECPNARAAEAGPGALSWSLEPHRVAMLAGPSRVVLRLAVNGEAHSALGVPVVLSLRSPAWVARRPFAAGEALHASDTELREVQWPVGARPVAAADAPPSGRARLALKPGDVVSASQLTPPHQALQGDAVKVALRSGAITLEMPAVLASNAQVGQPARVQLKGRHDTLQGVLVDVSTVIVER